MSRNGKWVEIGQTEEPVPEDVTSCWIKNSRKSYLPSSSSTPCPTWTMKQTHLEAERRIEGGNGEKGRRMENEFSVGLLDTKSTMVCGV